MIEFKNLEVAFKQKKKVTYAVKDVSFKIPEGEIFGIIGSSGAGKSTVLRTINLLQKPTGGHVIVAGKNIEHYKRSELRHLRKGIGMIFQHFNLVESKTVKENIAFVMRAAGKQQAEIEKKVDELLEVVGLAEYKEAYPNRLSGGQKQRVAIARALANDAKILLCDEPTSALDLETTKAILDLLKSINQKWGITIVIITHELEVVKQICDTVAVMNKGRLIEMGRTYELFTTAKETFTKQLIQHDGGLELPNNLLKPLEGCVVKLQYQGERANAPVISDAIEKFHVKVNILLGRIEYIGALPLGTLYVQLLGETQDITRVLTYLEVHTERLEVIQDAG